jgi:hypothetical protein
LTQLISNDRSGLPGICTAVRQRVCVSVGAPGPVHEAANAALVEPSETAAKSAGTAAEANIVMQFRVISLLPLL